MSAQSLHVSKPQFVFEEMLVCPKRIEFVGHDVCADGNRPAQSKHSLLQTWPKFIVSRDVSSFLGVMNFYSSYIPYFEQCAAPLRELANLDAETNITASLTDVRKNARVDLIQAILSDPVIGHFDH